MKMPLIRVGKIVFAALTAISAVSVPASAAAPTRDPPGTTIIDLPGFTPCPYGYLDFNVTITGYGTSFVDSAGNITRRTAQAFSTVTYTNPLNGKIANGSSRDVKTFTGADPTTGQGGSQVSRGVTMSLNLPDGGKLKFAGRYIVDVATGSITFQTRHALPDAADDAALCAALE
jgi:hypothetical protein